ncbi:hypothetical protein Hokovirus_3_70 [Hokovirus HKV1]|uniref:Uncharacterized protein n=1 Tax=Hokovirus HKV1 TaxID=1977638 RepID=A0A1V0SGG1_9VIRU|nr:hypothetical protein Hokovirus_3_70 [Hokovirus HKV1]
MQFGRHSNLDFIFQDTKKINATRAAKNAYARKLDALNPDIMFISGTKTGFEDDIDYARYLYKKNPDGKIVPLRDLKEYQELFNNTKFKSKCKYCKTLVDQNESQESNMRFKSKCKFCGTLVKDPILWCATLAKDTKECQKSFDNMRSKSKYCETLFPY